MVTNEQVERAVKEICQQMVESLCTQGYDLESAITSVYKTNYDEIQSHVKIALMLKEHHERTPKTTTHQFPN